MPTCSWGPRGVGKATTARALAAALNCAQPGEDGDACGTCPSCRRMPAGTHPDFLVISPEESKAQIKIEQIRELRRLTAYPPLGGGWRVVLIKPAEALTAQNDAAANALLKTLEEPPDRHLLVLTARGEADLLPTIVSRCHKLAFAPLPSALIIQELERRRSLPRPQAALVAALSGGSLGRALALDPEELVRQRDQVLSDLAAAEPGLHRPGPGVGPAPDQKPRRPEQFPPAGATLVPGPAAVPFSGARRPPGPSGPPAGPGAGPGRRRPGHLVRQLRGPGRRPSAISRPTSTRN